MDSQAHKGGGIAIYLKDGADLHMKIIALKITLNKCFWTFNRDLKIKWQKMYVVIGIYRPPNNPLSKEYFFYSLQEIRLAYSSKINTRLIVMHEY